MAEKKPSKRTSSSKKPKGKGEAKGSAKQKPQMNPELEGFEISINEFGQISSTLDLDKVYEFLNKNVEDKKLKDRDDLKKGDDEGDEKSKKDKKK